jgi:CHAT domain-containing protein
MSKKAVPLWHKTAVLAILTLCTFTFLPVQSIAQDPVETFIIAADSVAQTGDQAAFARYVRDRSAIVGASVHQLIDVAIIVGDDGQKEAEEENIDFAERLALIYQRQTGSDVLVSIIKTYRGWTPQQRAERRKAKGLEEEATAARGESEFEEAARLLESAKAIYLSIGDAYSEAIVWGSLGVVYWYSGNFDAVIENYNAALAARRAIENRILEGRTLNGLGTTNFILEQFGTAVEYYLQAIEMRTTTGDIGGLGTSYTYLGNTYMYMGRLADSREAFEQALFIIDRIGTPMQRFDLLNSIGGLDAEMGLIHRSNDAFGRALDIAIAEQDPAAEIICRTNMALNLKHAFRFREALVELDRVEELLAENPDPQQSIIVHRNRGLIYHEMGNLDGSRDELLAFLRAAQEQGVPRSETEAMIKLGYVYLELGAYDHGLAFADSALIRAEQHEIAAMSREAHMLAAQLQRLSGRPDKALEHWQNALEQDESEGSVAYVIEDRIGIANVKAFAGDHKEARQELTNVRPLIYETGRLDLLLRLNFTMAHSWEGENPDSAHHYYEEALSIMEETRAEVGGVEFGGGYTSGKNRYFYEEIARYYAGVARETGDEWWSSEAFRTIERAKARGLLDLIESSLTSEHSESEKKLLDQIYRLDPAAESYQDDLRRLEEQYERARDQRLESATMALATDDLIAGIDEAKKALPKKTTMLVYALGDSASLLWAIDRRKCELHELPNRTALQNDVEMLKNALTSPGSGDDALRRTARKLYLSLVGPAEKRLGKSRHLIVVPDGCLFEIPFEVLLNEEPKLNKGWKSQAFLSKDYSTVYAPSVSVYLQLKKPRDEAKFDIDLIAAGDPDYAACFEGGALQPLPHSRSEIENISAYFDEKKKVTLLGAEANEALFKAKLGAHAPRLVHLAAHGLVDPVNPAASSIALCPGPEGDEDGYLYTLEILSLPLDSKFVVLSACESARGRIWRGEGVVGLSRAFIGAGASGVVSSLWAVSDESTSQLMSELFKRMVDKKKPAGQALNEARRALLEDPAYAHPFYWSPFIVIGSEISPW